MKTNLTNLLGIVSVSALLFGCGSEQKPAAEGPKKAETVETPEISEEDLAHVMEPGFSHWPEVTSAGMGLSIGHDIAEALGGVLRINSVEGEYTTVQIAFVK